EGECNADAPRYPRDHPGGSGPFRRRPHSRRAPAPYRPLRAGWAFCAWALRGDRKHGTPASARYRGRKRREGLNIMSAPAKSEQDRVFILDTTLRDGEQCPGATMTHEEKLEVAELLDQMGVDIIEAGFPIASEGDFAAVQEIARRTNNAVVCGLSRAAF